MSKFSFSRLTLAVAASLMKVQKDLMDKFGDDPDNNIADTMSQEEADRLAAALEALTAITPDDVDPEEWAAAACYEADLDTAVRVHAANDRFKARRELEGERKQAAIYAAIAKQCKVPEFLVPLCAQMGLIGSAPTSTETIEVPEHGKIHVWGLDKLRAMLYDPDIDGKKD